MATNEEKWSLYSQLLLYRTGVGTEILRNPVYLRIPDYVQNILWAVSARDSEILGLRCVRIPVWSESGIRLIDCIYQSNFFHPALVGAIN